MPQPQLHSRQSDLSPTGRASDRPAMNSPVCRAAPHQWGWERPSRIHLPCSGRGLPRALSISPETSSPGGVQPADRPAMNSPVYRAAPHQWGWGGPSRIRLPCSGRGLPRALWIGPEWCPTSRASDRPAMNSPVYRAAPHQWGWERTSRIHPALWISPETSSPGGAPHSTPQLVGEIPQPVEESVKAASPWFDPSARGLCLVN